MDTAMLSEKALKFWSRFYARLISLYPRAYYDRFGQSMMQTFNDLCRERDGASGSPVFWIFAETSGHIVREHVLQRTKTMYGVVLASVYIAIISTLGLDGDLVGPLYLAAIAVIILGAVIGFIETRKHPRAYRFGMVFALMTALLIAWANPAVGMIGNESNQANLMFLAVFAVAIIGGAVAGFRPRGMALAMFAAGGAQLLIGVISYFSALPLPQIHNTAFAAFWVGAGLLFSRAAAPRAR